MARHLTRATLNEIGSDIMVEIAARNRTVARQIDEWAGEVQDQMKQNAPWKDITGAARAGLFANVETNDGPGVMSRTVHCGYTVPYGEFLELGNGGVRAIVRPTLDAMFPQLDERVKTTYSDQNSQSSSGHSGSGIMSTIIDLLDDIPQLISKAMGEVGEALGEVGEVVGEVAEVAGEAAL